MACRFNRSRAGWLALLALPLAQAVAAPPPKDFFGHPQVSKATLSPHGTQLAYLYTQANGRQGIAVRDTRDPQQLTVVAASQSEDAPIDELHWVNENRLAFTVKHMRVEFTGNRDEYAVNRDGTGLTHLISGNWNHSQGTIGTQIKSRLLTADYAYFGATHDGSDDIIVSKYKWNQFDLKPESSRLYRLHTKTRALTDMLPGGQPEKVQGWLLDSDDVVRIAYSVDKGRCIVSYRDKDAMDWTEISNTECANNDGFSPAFFDSRNTLYVTAGHKGYSALYPFDIARRTRAAEPMVALDGFDFRGTPVIDYTGGKVLGIHFESDAPSTAWLDPRMKSLQQKIDTLLPGRVNMIGCGLDCASAPALLVASMSDRDPVEYLLYTPAKNELVLVGSQHPAIKPAEMGPRAFHRLAARDGRAIPVYVTMPPGKHSGLLPAVVLVHGGPWVRGVSWQWDEDAQFLASRGYVVLQPESRGSRGYGSAHFRAGWKQWGQAMQDDLADTAKWAVAQGWADPGRIAIMGDGYGGYATLMGLIRHPELFRCGIDINGITDIDLMFNSRRDYTTGENRDYSMRTLIGDPDKDAAMLRQNSPAALAGGLTRPVLIVHGAENLVVPIEHARQLRSSLNSNKAVEWKVYSDEGNFFRHEANRLDLWKRAETFLQGSCK